MKKNILLTIITLCLLCVNLQAQENVPPKYCWYGGVNVGTQLLFSSDVDNLSAGQRFTPAFSITAGKWFSPVWGARLQLGGFSLNGFSTTDGLYLANPLTNGLIFGNDDPVRNEVSIRPDGSYRHFLRYMNIHADFQLSLLNVLYKYRSFKWDIIPGIGIGYFRTFEYKGTPSTDNISTNFSIMGKYNVWKNLDVNLELSWAVLPGSFDGRITDKMYESNMAITVGAVYNFPKRVKKDKPTARKPSVYQYHHVEVVQVRDTVERIIEKEGAQIMKREPFTLASIRFGLSKSSPNKGQEIQFVNIAKYLENAPNARILVEGFGDKATGSKEENMKISVQRAEMVKKILVEDYKVDARKVESKGLGTLQQPYKENNWNRVVLITAYEE